MGTPKELFLEEESTLDEFTCPICIEILKFPIRLDTCIHVFCKNCIDDWFDKQNESVQDLNCPVCRTEANFECKKVNLLVKSRPNQQLGVQFALIVDAGYLPDEFQNQLDNLNMKCVNAANGCMATFKYKDAEQHEAQCQFKQ